MRLGRGRVVHVAADVEIGVVGLGEQLGHGHDLGVIVHVGESLVSGDDFLDVLGAEVVLRTAGEELGVGVDEKHALAAGLGFVGVGGAAGAVGPHDDDAGGDAGAVEEILRQADDGLDEVFLQPLAANLALGPAAEKHAVGHDGGDLTILAADGEHVLGKHEVALLAGGGAPAPAEALLMLHVLGGVVHGEGRVGDDAVETLQVAAVLVPGVQECVGELDVRAGDAVEEHVEAADRPRGGVVDLAAEAEVGGIAAALLHVFAADNEHAARADGGIVNAHAGLGLEDAHDEANHVARGVEVAALLARRLREHVDQKLVGRAEKVGELEILVAQPVGGEVADECLASLVGDDAFAALGADELHVIEDVLQPLGVGLGQGLQGGVEDMAELDGGVLKFRLQIAPARALRHEKAVVEIGVFAVFLLGLLGHHAGFHLAGDELLALGLKHIGATL